MKRHAAFFKNIAALLMLLALLSLLLPFCKITTETSEATISGLGIMKVGAGIAYEYHQDGTILNTYEVANGITWGDLKSGVFYVKESDSLEKIAVAGAVASLPVVFCFLAMGLTFLASGKKTMILPTLFILIAVVQNIIMLFGFYSLQSKFTSALTISLLIGIFAFTLLCAAAAAIIVFLWVTGGFRKPKVRESRFGTSDSDDDDTEDKREKDKKDGFFKRNKKDKKDKKRRKSRRKKKKSNRRNKKQRSEKGNQTTNQTEQMQEQQAFSNTAAISGLSGIYEGVQLTANEAGSFVVGTTKQAVSSIASGMQPSMESLEGAYCVIQHNAAQNTYTIMSHSAENIILQMGTGSKEFVPLERGGFKIVGPDTLFYAGSPENCIHLS